MLQLPNIVKVLKNLQGRKQFYIALSGGLVGVNVFLDIAQIAYNYYQLCKSSHSNTTIQFLIKQFQTSLKGQYVCFCQLLLSKF